MGVISEDLAAVRDIDELDLTPEAVKERRLAPEPDSRVIFKLAGLYGLSDPEGMRMPLNREESIESGQMCITLDPDAPPQSNIGIIDYTEHKLRVRYGVQAVFPGLYDLVMEGRHDPSLLSPVRAVATDMCSVTEDYTGWHALGHLEFLPGSIWAGAAGG